MAAPLSRIAPGSLFASIGLIMLGFGLQSSVLGVRAVIEDFSVVITGALMSSYYLGFFGGSLVTPRSIAGVGHVRVFAAFASVASSAVLLHPVFVEPVAWALMRFVTGFCYAGLYVVIESWLNEIAENRTRGRLLALYGLITQGALAGGYILLNLGDPGKFPLFALTSILVSLSLVPIALSARATSKPGIANTVALSHLYRVAPLGVLGCAVIGAAHGTFYTMGSVYARQEALTLPEISAFMAAFLVGGMMTQWPIGKISDHIDRRWLIALSAAAAAATAVAGVAIGRSDLPDLVLALATLLLGGLSLPIYGLCVAHVNDHLDRTAMIAATSRLILLLGAGAVVGPALAGLVMAVIGPEGFYVALFALHAVIGVSAVLVIGIRPRVDRERAKPYRPLPPKSAGVSGAWSGTEPGRR